MPGEILPGKQVRMLQKSDSPRSASVVSGLMVAGSLAPSIRATDDTISPLDDVSVLLCCLLATTMEDTTGCCWRRNWSIQLRQLLIRWGSVPPTTVSLVPPIDSCVWVVEGDLLSGIRILEVRFFWGWGWLCETGGGEMEVRFSVKFESRGHGKFHMRSFFFRGGRKF